jgi:hypothetical protein
MATRDAWEFINDLDRPTVETFINRLKYHGQDSTFSQFRGIYEIETINDDLRKVDLAELFRRSASTFQQTFGRRAAAA